MKLNKYSVRSTILSLAIAVVFGSISWSVMATPYASLLKNDGSGNISFYLNESGGDVTIKYEDGSTDANFNGVTTGTNLDAGQYSFALGAHTSYTISVYKVGAGVPTLITNSIAFTPRGIDVNSHPGSPYFGQIYVSRVSSPNGLYAFNPDFSIAVDNTTAGVPWQNGNTYEPYRISVADDGYLMVGDAGYVGGSDSLNDGVYRIAPDLSSSQLFLGPAGYLNGVNAGVHGTIGSRPVLLGDPNAGPVTLLDVDMDFQAANGYNSLLVYKNITLDALPWQNPPDIQGPEIGLNISGKTLGGNPYPGLQVHGNYIYAGTFRANYSNPLLQIYTNDIAGDGTLAPVWNSRYTPTDDYFLRSNGGNTAATIDIAVSPDGKYVVGVSILNWFVICPLTNGLPDVDKIFMNTPTSYSGNARAVAFDAADNIYLSSSGLGLCQSWSLGITTVAVTTGDANGSTDFSVTFPSTDVYVTATSNFASQGGSNGTVGTPIPGVFTITRTNAVNDYSEPVTVNFTLSGTATNGVYTVSPAGITPGATNSIVLPAGVVSTNIMIIPTTDNVPRRETTVVLSLNGGVSYSVIQPASDTVYIQNTSENQLVVSAGAPTMYKAYANDFASITITRLGDTNVSYTVPAAAFTYSGTAVPGTDFTPIGDVTVNAGDITKTVRIHPLSNGVPPEHTANPVYVGDKSVSVTLSGTSDYIISEANSSSLTLIDNADPPAAVLFSDPLTDPADASNWNITFGSGDEINHPADYNVDFGYDITPNNPELVGSPGLGLPPNGASNVLRITCLKNDGVSYGGGVNVYYTNQAFSGNYAVRFNMMLVEGSVTTFGVEGAMFGINHNGMETNWWLGNGSTEPGSGPWASDGIWYWVQAPPGGIGGFGFTDFQEYTGLGGALPNTGWTQLATRAALPNVYKRAVFSAPGALNGGTPANNSPYSTNPQDNSWADVEIKQLDGVITLSINKTVLFTYANTTTFTSGYLMLGYNCPIQGAFNQYVNTPEAGAYFSNLRVVSLALPTVIISTQVINGGTEVQIDFTGTDGDTTGSFAVQSSAIVASGYADVGATITQLDAQTFRAVLPVSGSQQFYRIRHN